MLNACISLVNAQNSEKRFLRNFYGTYSFHAPLPGLLFLEQFAFP
jgi:hypothetical protein